VQDALRIGIAIFNAGDHHAAHDAWEERWLELEDGNPEERLLHGLIQYTAAVYHARNRNWSGARGLAESAERYLAGVDDGSGVNVDEVRASLRRLAADPETAERRGPIELRYDGDALESTDLSFEEVAAAARILAAEYDTFDEEIVADAIRFAREERNGDTSADVASPRDRGFIAMLFDFAADRDRRALVYDRLQGHVGRRRSRERDVSQSGLFE